MVKHRKELSDRTVQCTFCQRQFSRVEHLRRHERGHTGEKPYECNICGATYSRSDVLSRHLACHPASRRKSRRPLQQREPLHSLEPRHLSLSMESATINSTIPEARLSLNCDSSELSTGACLDFIEMPTRILQGSEENEYLSGCNDPSTEYLGPLQCIFPHQQVSSPQAGLGFSTNCVPGDVSAALAISISPVPAETANCPEYLPQTESYNMTELPVTRDLRQTWSVMEIDTSSRIVSTLWQNVICHPEDSLFCIQTDSQSVFPTCSHQNERGYTAQLENLLWEMRAVKDASCTVAPQTEGSFAANYPRPSESNGFSLLPSSVILDLGLDYVFNDPEQAIQFLHRPTFHPESAPHTILLPLLLMGWSLLNYDEAVVVIEPCLMGLIRFYRGQVVAKARANCSISDFFCVLAGTLLVMNIALGNPGTSHRNEAHMLCALTLHVMEKNGLLSDECINDAPQSLHRPYFSEKEWKTWARVESVKRLIIGLLRMDAAYAQLLGTAGTVDLDNLAIFLPSDDRLFMAPTFNNFVKVCNTEKVSSPILTMDLLDNSKIAKSVSLSRQTAWAVVSIILLRLQSAHRRLVSENIESQWKAISPIGRPLFFESIRPIVALVMHFPLHAFRGCWPIDPAIMVMWHYSCVLLTADIELFKFALGKGTSSSTRQALEDLRVWSQTPSARRCVLHSAQIFLTISSSVVTSVSMGVWFQHCLYHTALILALYIFVAPSYGQEESPFELFQTIDWSHIGGLAISKDQNDCMIGDLCEFWEVENFVRHGAKVAILGIIQDGNRVCVKGILLRFAYLAERINQGHGASYSELLRILSVSFVQTPQNY